MGGNDDVVEVGFAEEGGEEGVWVGDVADGYQRGVRDVAVTPVQGLPQLPAALDQEQRCGAHLHTTRRHHNLTCVGVPFEMAHF